jgi:hypothetical protein
MGAMEKGRKKSARGTKPEAEVGVGDRTMIHRREKEKGAIGEDCASSLLRSKGTSLRLVSDVADNEFRGLRKAAPAKRRQ